MKAFHTFTFLLFNFSGLILLGQQRTFQLKISQVEVDSSTFVIQDFRMYIGQISLINEGQKVHSESDFHLLDLINGKSEITFYIPEKLDFDAIEIHLGTDSTTNDSGYLEGDLDPINGMYWTWQSGYINFKLEAMGDELYFEHHLGGFLEPYPTQQNMRFTCFSDSLQLWFDTPAYLGKMFDQQEMKIMSTGAKAQKWSKIASEHFYQNKP